MGAPPESMRKSELPHRLQIEINLNDKKLTESHCSCIAGSDGHCSHIVGLLKSLQGLKLHNYTSVPQHQSCTSVPQQWNVPRGQKIKPAPINHIVVAHPLENGKRKPIVCHLDENYPLPTVKDVELQNLAEIRDSPLQYILSSTRMNIPTTSTPFGDVPIGSSLSYQVNSSSGLSPGKYTVHYAETQMQHGKRVQGRAEKPSTKRRRLILKQERVITQGAHEALEGISYQSGEHIIFSKSLITT